MLLGQVGGGFAPKADYPVGNRPFSVAIADLNGDSRLDIVTANYYSDNVSVLLGQGGGVFGARTDYPVGSQPYSVAIGDVNGDDRPDIVTANSGSRDVSVLLGQAGGGFASRVNYTVNNRPLLVVIVDVNNDNRPDIVAVTAGLNVGDAAVSVLLGQGGGVFGARTDYPVGSEPYALAVADLNADGRLDIVTASFFEGVSVLLGQAGGGFTRTDYPVGSGPQSVAIADINADRRLDIITANFAGGSVSVLLGQGDGGFGARTDYPVGSEPYSVAIGDVNGDGRLDIVTANRAGNSVSVLTQVTSSQPTLSVSGPLNCNTASVKLSAQGGPVGAQYAFSGPAVSGASSTTTLATQPGEYTVTVSNLVGCSARATAQVEGNTTPPQNVSLTNSGTLSANNPTVTLTASSNATANVGVSYEFSQPSRKISTNQATVTISGTYSVTATRSDNGCTATAQTTVLGASSVTACRGSSATVSLVAAGSAVRYEWYVGVATGQPLRDGSVYQGATTANLTVTRVTQSQVYYAKVFYADGSSVVYGPYRVTLNTNCGAREAASVEPGTELRITLLGNPLQGEALRALVAGAAGQRLQVSLVDLSGRPVRSQVIEASDSTQLLEWSLSGWASGQYLLQAVSGQQYQSVKVVKP